MALPSDNPRIFSANRKRAPAPKDMKPEGDVSKPDIQDIKTASELIAGAKTAAERMKKSLNASDTGARAYEPMTADSYDHRQVSTRELVERQGSEGLKRSK